MCSLTTTKLAIATCHMVLRVTQSLEKVNVIEHYQETAELIFERFFEVEPDNAKRLFHLKCKKDLSNETSKFNIHARAMIDMIDCAAAFCFCSSDNDNHNYNNNNNNSDNNNCSSSTAAAPNSTTNGNNNNYNGTNSCIDLDLLKEELNYLKREHFSTNGVRGKYLAKMEAAVLSVVEDIIQTRNQPRLDRWSWQEQSFYFD